MTRSFDWWSLLLNFVFQHFAFCFGRIFFLPLRCQGSTCRNNYHAYKLAISKKLAINFRSIHIANCQFVYSNNASMNLNFQISNSIFISKRLCAPAINFGSAIQRSLCLACRHWCSSQQSPQTGPSEDLTLNLKNAAKAYNWNYWCAFLFAVVSVIIKLIMLAKLATLLTSCELV